MEYGDHETGVQAFYSTGAELRASQCDGFLSFGYWTKDTKDYLQAAENLLEFTLKGITIPENASILNVSCGFGAETLRIYEHFRPSKIIGLDLTPAHIDYAKQRIANFKFKDSVSKDSINFELGNACNLKYPDNSFDLVIGIEGPAHYNTRQDFLREAYRVLRPNGRLLLADIIATPRMLKQGVFLNFFSNLTAKAWHMPKENQVSLIQYSDQLTGLGFKIDRKDCIGDKVFQGFADGNLKFAEIIRTIKTRGFFAGVGLTFISWLLAYVYRKGLTDYIIISAVK